MSDDLKARLRGMDGDSMSIKTLDEAADRIEALELALTQSRAETAAAYERAASIIDERHRIYMTAKHRNPDDYVSDWSFSADAIRALTTPDQTAVLDVVRAEAMREAAEIARNIKGGDGYIEMLVSDTILSAIKGAKA